MLSTSLSRFQCPSCRFISKDRTLLNPSERCPSCSTSGVPRRIFPDLSASHLLNMIEHFYSIASQTHHDELFNLTAHINEVLEQSLSERAIYKGWLEINRIFSKNKNYDEVIEHITQFFRCDEAKAMDILHIYMTPKTKSPELTVVPILVVALVEVLLSRFLVALQEKYHHVTIAEARDEVKTLRSFEERYNHFTNTTGIDFRLAIQQTSKSFWSKWEHTRKKRNVFVHGNPYALGWEMCDKSYNIALESIDVFAELNNRFSVLP
jgi:hypothetical protein